jgi:hypothetical protein
MQDPALCPHKLRGESTVASLLCAWYRAVYTLFSLTQALSLTQAPKALGAPPPPLKGGGAAARAGGGGGGSSSGGGGGGGGGEGDKRRTYTRTSGASSSSAPPLPSQSVTSPSGSPSSPPPNYARSSYTSVAPLLQVPTGYRVFQPSSQTACDPKVLNLLAFLVQRYKY